MPHVFLYGPDSLQAHVYDRIGPSDVVGGALLEGYQLVFNKPNMKNKDEGLSNIVETSGRSVFGVVYDLTHKQLELLDGYYGGYQRKAVDVKLPVYAKQTDEEGGVAVSGPERYENRNATTWIARRIKAGLRPSKPNLDATVRGAKENGAPPQFQQEIGGIEALHG
jgi:hypothetical protein